MEESSNSLTDIVIIRSLSCKRDANEEFQRKKRRKWRNKEENGAMKKRRDKENGKWKNEKRGGKEGIGDSQQIITVVAGRGCRTKEANEQRKIGLTMNALMVAAVPWIWGLMLHRCYGAPFIPALAPLVSRPITYADETVGESLSLFLSTVSSILLELFFPPTIWTWLSECSLTLFGSK